MKRAANLSTLFQELPVAARFAAAKASGFDGVALSAPYDHPAQEIRDLMVMNGLGFAAMPGPPPNYTGAPPGYAALPGGEDRFRRDFRRMMRYVDVLKPAAIRLEAGEAEGAAAQAALLDNLTWACETAPKWNFVIGPRADRDQPGAFLTRYDQVAEVLNRVGAENLGLVFDSFDALRIAGDAAAVWAEHGARTSLVQIAQSPGRDDPGPTSETGEIDFPALLETIAGAGYSGWVVADYTPRLTTQAGLGWLAP